MYFPTTHWSLLARASLDGAAEARTALDELCRRYWGPIHQFIRWRGYNETEAEDLTQAFLLHLLERSVFRKPNRLKGRFRSFLLGALTRFLANQRDHARAQKRGGGAEHLSLDDEPGPTPAAQPAEAAVFDREWGLTILENALRQAEAEFGLGENAGRFGVLQRFLPGAVEVISYEAAAARLNVGLPALKSEVFRLRQCVREMVRREVAATVSAPHELDAEMSHLQAVLLDRGHNFGAAAKPLPPPA
jgi:RNA polymerase sigma-70 factor (ECF subfamily)